MDKMLVRALRIEAQATETLDPTASSVANMRAAADEIEHLMRMQEQLLNDRSALREKVRRWESEAWNRINAIGSPDSAEAPGDQFAKGVNHAVDQALNIIKELGGRDPSRPR